MTAGTGEFVNSGKLGSNATATLTSGRYMLNSGSMLAGGDMEIVSGGSFTTIREIQVFGKLGITSYGNLVNSGVVKVGGSIAALSETGVFGNSGGIAANGAGSFRSATEMENLGIIQVLGGIASEADPEKNTLVTGSISPALSMKEDGGDSR